MINIVPYHKSYLDQIMPRPVYGDDPLLKMRTLDTAGSLGTTAMVLLKNQTVLAIIGWTEYWPGMAEIWGVISDDVQKHPLEFHRAVKRLSKRWLPLHPMNRIQVTVKATFSQGCRWVESFGFKKEALMKKYLPGGDDAYMYARVT